MGEREHAVSYLRVSGKGQIDGDGFDRQRAAVAHFARANGYAIVEEYRDERVSGTKELARRPGLARLLDRLESNGVRAVLIEGADRLARDLLVSEVIIGQFQKVGARVLTAGGVDLTASDHSDPTRTLIRQVLSAVAQFDKKHNRPEAPCGARAYTGAGGPLRGRKAVRLAARRSGHRAAHPPTAPEAARPAPSELCCDCRYVERRGSSSAQWSAVGTENRSRHCDAGAGPMTRVTVLIFRAFIAVSNAAILAFVGLVVLFGAWLVWVALEMLS